MTGAVKALYWLAFHLFAALPLDVASNLGGWLGRTFGPRLGVRKIARRNLVAAFPEKSPAEIDSIMTEMWDNLGRVMAEFPHIGRMDIYNDPRFEISGIEHADAMRDDGKPGIFFTPHLGNWELSAHAVIQRGPWTTPLAIVYRAANDPAAEWLLRYGRKGLKAEMIAKGTSGARRIVEVLKAGGHIGMLPDQKMNDGIPAPFFGRPAMTAPAIAQLALKYDCYLLPGYVERIGRSARFRLRILPPMALPKSGDRKADIVTLTAEINLAMESWIRRNPGQWLWVHRRWPD
ncbi:MAG: lysophospholipid acyltransferase family protein [Alphaproteobacteria bacterium]